MAKCCKDIRNDYVCYLGLALVRALIIYDIKMSSMSGFEIGRSVSKMIINRGSMIYNNNNKYLKLGSEKNGSVINNLVKINYSIFASYVRCARFYSQNWIVFYYITHLSSSVFGRIIMGTASLIIGAGICIFTRLKIK